MSPLLQRCTLALALASLPMLAATAADDTSSHTVHFAKGTSSSTVNGSLKGYDNVNYTLGANAGQTMTVTLTGSSNAYFNVIAPGQDYAMENAREMQEWSGVLPAKGTYRIEVFQPRAQARRGETANYAIKFVIH